jgi:hypothetical protein
MIRRSCLLPTIPIAVPELLFVVAGTCSVHNLILTSSKTQVLSLTSNPIRKGVARHAASRRNATTRLANESQDAVTARTTTEVRTWGRCDPSVKTAPSVAMAGPRRSIRKASLVPPQATPAETHR